MDWSIRPRAHLCAGTGKDFSDGQVVYTVLVAGEGGMERKDYAEEVWSQEGIGLRTSVLEREVSNATG